MTDRTELLATITTQVLLAGEKPFTYDWLDKAIAIAVNIVDESVRLAEIAEKVEAEETKPFAHQDVTKFDLKDYMTVSDKGKGA